MFDSILNLYLELLTIFAKNCIVNFDRALNMPLPVLSLAMIDRMIELIVK